MWITLEVQKRTGDLLCVSFPSGELGSKRTAPWAASASEQWGGSISKEHAVLQDSLPLFCSEWFPDRERKAARGPLIYSYSTFEPPSAGAATAAVLKTIARERSTEKGPWESSSPSFLPLLSTGRFLFCFCVTSGAGSFCPAQTKLKEQVQTGVLHLPCCSAW